MNALRLDYALAMHAGSECGLTEAHLDAEAPAFRRGLERVLAEADAGVLGFWNLPRGTQIVEKIEAFVATQGHIEDVLVLGIGGSSLGGRALYESLALTREGGPARRVHYPDNIDPTRLVRLLNSLDANKTLAIAISKSGGTIETAAQLLAVRGWLSERLGDKASKHLAIITDPKNGALRPLAEKEGLAVFDIPPNVGGRFSVLTPVGLLPAALAGIDIAGLLKGAAAMAERCARPQLRENPAGMLAALHALHHRLHGRSVHVMMPYADSLREVAFWFVQLWAESLGKRSARDGRMLEVGPTPIPAVGATDQHAQVQLFMEGPRDKLVSFLAVDDLGVDLKLPKEEGAFGYLAGHSMVEILNAERRGTALALAEDRRPSLTIHLPRIDAPSVGGLLFLWEAATAIAGELYGIDAFNQPGVELGKRLAYGLLGREGFEAEATKVREAEATRPRFAIDD